VSGTSHPAAGKDTARHKAEIVREFDRAAAAFSERTKERFDETGIVEFSRVTPTDSVLEVGAGTGNFLALFEGHAARRIALDLTPGMLRVAREKPGLDLLQGDGHALPVQSRSVELVASAQALHHIWEPLPVLREMRRVASRYVLIVDQLASENYEEIAFMNQLETIRDPTHAMSRPRSAFHILIRSAGLEIVDEKIHEDQSRFSKWMWPEEFPEERIAATRDFVERFGAETGMGFEPDGDDWIFTRRRIMLLAERA
jgi:ubiquinone/menaquinone biosynthesis C-methylase UbiE